MMTLVGAISKRTRGFFEWREFTVSVKDHIPTAPSTRVQGFFFVKGCKMSTEPTTEYNR